jgi:glycerol transport system substrate-binding protein
MKQRLHTIALAAALLAAVQAAWAGVADAK